jgi:hypothetical protein
MKIDDFLKRGWLYQATGYTVLTSFILVLLSVIFVEIPEGNREIYVHALGIIEGAFVGNLVNHFFGSSSNSKPKDPTVPQ